MPDSEEISDLENTFSLVAVALFEAGTVASTLQRSSDLPIRRSTAVTGPV